MFFPLRQSIDEIKTFLDDLINGGERPIQFSLRELNTDRSAKSSKSSTEAVPSYPRVMTSVEVWISSPQQRLVAHDLAVVADIGGAGDRLHKFR